MAKAAHEATGTVSIRLVWPFIALARKSGHERAVARVHELLGLTKAQLEDPDTRVASELVVGMLQQAIAASGNRDVGLLAARFVDAAHIGISEYLARSRPTVDDALQSGARYLRLLGDGAQYGLERKGKLAYWRVALDPKLIVHEAAYEFVVAAGVLYARRLTGIRELAPLEVHFMHERPRDVALHEKLLRCRLRFAMPVTQVVMSAAFLRTPLATAEPALGRLLERQAEAMLERLPRSDDLPNRVRSLLRAERKLGDASAERIARRLGMSVRTLGRKLDGERTSYRALLDEVRKQAAQRERVLPARVREHVIAAS